jgi:hypothetical protein
MEAIKDGEEGRGWDKEEGEGERSTPLRFSSTPTPQFELSGNKPASCGSIIWSKAALWGEGSSN